MNPLIIAHRGASGYLPEHTLPAKALAGVMGADYLEQDLVATADDELVVLHDIYLDRVTDVAACFPQRQRHDGRYYVRDFSLQELRTLNVRERVNADGSAVYPRRYPSCSGEFRIHTFAEEIKFIREFNAATGGAIGIYPEIKRPAWHQSEGVDITLQVLQQLALHGYRQHSDSVFIQCFDARELRRIRHELQCPLRLVQLTADNSRGESDTDYGDLASVAGLRQLAHTVDAIAPWIHQLYQREAGEAPGSTDLAQNARDAGLYVHPYTFRADELPAGFAAFDDLVRFFAFELQVDALFTDFPDRVAKVLSERHG